jgi:hypothetical protein
MGSIHSLLIFALIFKILCMVPLSRMNNVQQCFQDNMGALSSQFETLSTSDNIHSLDERQQQLQNDFNQFTSIFDSFSSHYYIVYLRPPPSA